MSVTSATLNVAAGAAAAVGVAAGLLAFYVTAVETRVDRLERPR
jgi:hypothetical protein